ncbi:unnamed protein product [Adineta steineri]|uniref:DUF5580 domain-containing protein n=1 Tax=Adineta steineri TaxID=433720 RepID=A0A818HPI2_9BILA|nr:unnamed protein product [Adineta steineri]CAF3512094.1 unnamed protein product [Adineta steineri]
MYSTYMPVIDHHGIYSKKRMNIQPLLPIPVSYATAAIPTYAPFGTEYTPDQKVKIVGGRQITMSDSNAHNFNYTNGSLTKQFDPDLAPTKSIQHVHAIDQAQWPQQNRQRFDTTYRTEYINRIRHPNEATRPVRQQKSSLNNFFVLPPIASQTTRTDGQQQQQQQPYVDQEVPSNQMMSNGIPPINFYGQQQGMMNNVDTYLPEEPVLLTDYEEQRLSEQIRTQLGNPTIIDRLKLFYEELAKYDPNVTNFVHYSNIQLVASQLGLNLDEDTLRFAMCKFVSPNQGRGYVNYEDLIRYFGKCLSAIYPNQYGLQQNLNTTNTNGFYNQPLNQQNPYQTGMRVDNKDDGSFDPDERQIRNLLKQNIKNIEYNGQIDFNKLYNELRIADRSQTGVLNQHQIEEVVYKVRIPLQRSLIFQILEKHCKAYAKLYKWDAFVQYLQQQIADMNNMQPDQSNPMYTQNNNNNSTRNQLLEQLRREYKEKDRIQIIENYAIDNNVSRLDPNNPTAWFSRFLRFANAMYGHRTSTVREQEYVLPRQEALRHFRAYNHVYDLKIEEDKLQRVLDSCARNANISIDDSLKQFAK